MKKLAQMVLIMAIAFLPGNVLAGDITYPTFKKISALSGIDKQVGELPKIIVGGLDQAKQQGARIPDAKFYKIKNVMKKAYEPSKFIGAIGKEVRKKFSELEAKELLKWYESELGKTITKAEVDATSVAAYQDMMKQAQTLMADNERVLLAKRYDSLTNATDMAVYSANKTSISVFYAMSKVMNPSQPVDVKGFKAQLASNQFQVKKQMEQISALSFVYAYRNIDMKSLEKYFSFLEQPTSKKFNDCVMKGMKNGFNNSIKRMAISLGKK